MLAALDLLGQQWLPAFVLVLARVSGLFMFAPIFSSRLIPGRVRILLALGLTLAALPAQTAQQLPLDLAEIAVLVVKELIIGSAMGFAIAAVIAAVQMAGAFIDMQGGFAFANVVDPMQGTQISILGQAYSLLGSGVFLISGGHLVVVAGLTQSFDVVPVSQMPAFQRLLPNAFESAGGLIAASLVIAAPVVVTLILTDVAVGFLARLAPAMNIFGIEMPAKIVAMLALLAATAPFIVGSVHEHVVGGLDPFLDLIREMAPR